MSTSTFERKPGRVVVRPIRTGRRKSLGSIVFIEGVMMVYMGALQDGSAAAYVPLHDVRTLRGEIRAQESKPMYRLLKTLIRHYEQKQV